MTANSLSSSSIAIGFSTKDVPLSRPPGWEPNSWAYHGDDGHSYCCQSSGKGYGPTFTTDDVIGCGVNFHTGSAFFTKNGNHLGMHGFICAVVHVKDWHLPSFSHGSFHLELCTNIRGRHGVPRS